MRFQQGDDVSKDLICLFLHGGGHRSIRPNTNLPRKEDEFCAFGHSHRMTIEAKWRMHPCRI